MNGLSVALSFIFSAVFVLSLYIMDRMTKKANGKKRDELISKLKELKDKLESDEAKARLELEIVSLLSEPGGVLDKREIRRALAISITIAYFTMLSFAISNEQFENPGIISEFSKVFLVVIAFYFGSRAIEDAIKLKKGQVSQSVQTTQAQPQQQEAEKKEEQKKDEKKEGGGER